MSDINLTIDSTTDIALSVTSAAPAITISTVGAQGAQGAVSGTPISELTEVTSVNDTDILVIVSSGTTKRITALNLKTYFTS